MPYVSIAAFALLYLGVMLSWGISHLVAAAYLAASALCLILYAVDKSAAKGGRRRTPERTLLLCGLACGWPGAVLAQQWLRHKSSKKSFRLKFWGTVALNVAAFAALNYLVSAA
ncbi:DUF1294 domain-containing protein [Janthinobacterium fluminis]|uniref:DUF1294 domain-containing protein n=1 Tax=Janthinobacterium fluminis TaxID=2987524 RepID=A0ABT5JVM0_9BURK|nr:DUF1294 domain-containing protein [Janthinobacterium fluminis]MDC8756531.1 DUF1294 domain-containing protein [Janthinobacterium fluminis]